MSDAAPIPSLHDASRRAAFGLWRGFAAGWSDRAGRLSWLRLGTFALVLAPGVWLAAALALDAAGAEPAETALDVTGFWAVLFLVLSLAISPARKLFCWSALLNVRRMLGVACAVYVGLHLSAYVVDQNLDLARAASEIIKRFYLAVGLVAAAGLFALAITSTDRWVRRLGRRWGQLHALSYPIAALALWHYLMQSKLDASDATVLSGLCALLLLARAATAWRGDFTPAMAFGLAVLALPLVMVFEAFWYEVATSVPGERVWAANFYWTGAPRPAVMVAGLAALIAAAAAVRRWGRRGRLL
ncbi:MAG: ferric reductase-like transmembrane domain-containing protein [Pseudomonadota bacterium]